MNHYNQILGIEEPTRVLISTDALLFKTYSNVVELNKVNKGILAGDITVESMVKMRKEEFTKTIKKLDSYINRSLSLDVLEESAALEATKEIESNAGVMLNQQIFWTIRKLDYSFYACTNKTNEALIASEMLIVLNNIYFMLNKFNNVLSTSKKQSEVVRSLYEGMKDFINANHDNINNVITPSNWTYFYNASKEYSRAEYPAKSWITGYKQINGVWKYFDGGTREANTQRNEYVENVLKDMLATYDDTVNLINLKKDFDLQDISTAIKPMLDSMIVTTKSVDNITIDLIHLLVKISNNMALFDNKFPKANINESLKPLINILSNWIGTLTNAYNLFKSHVELTNMFVTKSIDLNDTVKVLKTTDTLKMLIKGI